MNIHCISLLHFEKPCNTGLLYFSHLTPEDPVALYMYNSMAYG